MKSHTQQTLHFQVLLQLLSCQMIKMYEMWRYIILPCTEGLSKEFLKPGKYRLLR